MFARLLMFAFIVSFVSCASTNGHAPKSPTDRVSALEDRGYERVHV